MKAEVTKNNIAIELSEQELDVVAGGWHKPYYKPVPVKVGIIDKDYYSQDYNNVTFN